MPEPEKNLVHRRPGLPGGLYRGPVVGTAIYGAEVSVPYLVVGLMLLALVPLWQGRLAEKKSAKI